MNTIKASSIKWPVELPDGEVIATVHYDFFPPERATSTYPGADADCDICEVAATIAGVCRDIKFRLSDDELERIRVEIMEREMAPEDEDGRF